MSQPQTIPQSQGSAQPQSQGSAQPVSAPVANASSQSSPAPAPTPVQANTSNQVPLPSASSTARPASLPVQQTSVPVTQTSNARPVLVSGGTAATGNAIPSTTAQQLPPGTVLRIQTQGAGLQARPVLVPAQGGDTPRSAPQAQAQPLQNATVAIANPVQQAISHTVQGSVFRQDSVAALLTTLAGLGGKIAELPRPVAQAGAELLNGRLNLDAKPLDGPVLKQALQRSGVLLESLLGKGAPVPQGDLKSGLLKLAGALRAFIGDGASAKTESTHRPPPPTPGATPRAGQPSNGAQAPELPPRELAARLLGQAEAALSRMRLTQLSSLPDAAIRGGTASGPAAELNMELPLLLGGQLSVGQFQILRDGGNGSGRERDGSWKMKFSINFSQTGEVGATVTLRVKKIGVMLWAEREDMAEALEEMSDELEQVLIARGLEPGSIRVRQGPPPPAKRAIGAYMDDWS